MGTPHLNTSGFARNDGVAKKAQLQISNHLRVCVTVPSDLVVIYGVAASELITKQKREYLGGVQAHKL